MRRKLTVKQLVLISLAVVTLLILGIVYVVGGSALGRLPKTRPTTTADSQTTPLIAETQNSSALPTASKPSDSVPSSTQTPALKVTQTTPASRQNGSSDNFVRVEDLKPTQPKSEDKSVVGGVAHTLKNILGSL